MKNIKKNTLEKTQKEKEKKRKNELSMPVFGDG
jgi:hypothetical protein